MRTAEAGCRAHGKGVCPGYLADAARLGRWGPAWKVVTASVLAHPEGGFPDKLCAGVRVETACRPGEASRPIPTYGEAVRLFLEQRGYPVPAG